MDDRGVPSPESVRSVVSRGRSALFPLNPAVSVQEAFELRDPLQRALGDDLLVIASPGSHGGPASLTVLQLVGEAEARQCRAELDALVADFRVLANGLVEQFRLHVEPEYERGEPYPDEVGFGGRRWWLEVHGQHCRFEGLDDGIDGIDGMVVEADTGCPDAIDAYFLLVFARTSGGYPRVCAACVEGFHDMCRLLEIAGHAA